MLSFWNHQALWFLNFAIFENGIILFHFSGSRFRLTLNFLIRILSMKFRLTRNQTRYSKNFYCVDLKPAVTHYLIHIDTNYSCWKRCLHIRKRVYMYIEVIRIVNVIEITLVRYIETTAIYTDPQTPPRSFEKNALNPSKN